MNPVVSAYKIAQKELGTAEVPGEASNMRIVEYHKSTTLAATDDKIAWCSAFMCWCLEQAGIISTKSAMARSYLSWGEALEMPYEGCVVILKRGNPPSGHVAFYVKENEHYVYCLGGNQKDSVCVSAFLKTDVLSYRQATVDTRQ